MSTLTSSQPLHESGPAELGRQFRLAHLAQAALQSPVLHFLVLGALLFSLAPAPRDGAVVKLDPARVQLMARIEHDRAPAEPEATARGRAEMRAVEDELLYREALRLGLDRDDSIVRQRMIQKMLLLAEELAGASRPLTEADVAAHYRATPARWQGDETWRFQHLFATSREGAQALVAQVSQTSGADLPQLGLPFALSRDATLTMSDVGAVYGPAFASGLRALRLGTWSDPVESKFGWHLVRVVNRKPSRLLPLAEVENEVALELLVSRREAAVTSHLERLFSRAEVSIGEQPLRAYRSTRRVAPRPEASAEDGP
jgi:peptidyl-prolyl cis-trans isomerase C